MSSLIKVNCIYCGKEDYVNYKRSRSYKYCCYEHKRLYSDEHPRKDRTGQRIGILTVIGYSGIHERGKTARGYYWTCMCDCGSIVNVPWKYLNNRHRTSCGCRAYAGMASGIPVNRLEYGQSRLHEIYLSYRNRAKKKGLDFQISLDYFTELTKMDCYYCGQPPSQQWSRTQNQHGNYTYTGIDRIDNSKGYILGNIRPSCGQCNRAKGTMSDVDFLAWIRRVHKHSFEQ